MTGSTKLQNLVLLHLVSTVVKISITINVNNDVKLLLTFSVFSKFRKSFESYKHDVISDQISC